MLIGNRIPKAFFVTTGVGESDITVHAGSYHLALREAGIEMANIITYSSILPKDAVETEARPHIVHGEVMETIMAEVTVEYPESGTTGIIFGWLYNAAGERHGGLVCEYHGSLSEEDCHPHLKEMLNELHQNGYEKFALRDVTVITRSVKPVKMYGTAIVALCFYRYEVPTFSSSRESQNVVSDS
jgi:arginine decarboxylase